MENVRCNNDEEKENGDIYKTFKVGTTLKKVMDADLDLNSLLFVSQKNPVLHTLGSALVSIFRA